MFAETSSIVAIAVVLLACHVSAYPNGAPPSACSTLSPSHDNTASRSSGCPVQIIAPEYYTEREDLTITLRAIGTRNFKGYLLSILESVPDTNTVRRAFGVFQLDPDQLVICNGGSVTHTNAALKTEVNVTWKVPPNQPGTPLKRYFVWLAAVESFEWFWVNQCGNFYIKSDTLRPNTTTASEMSTTTTTTVAPTSMETTTPESSATPELSTQPDTTTETTQASPIETSTALPPTTTPRIEPPPFHPSRPAPIPPVERSTDAVTSESTTPDSTPDIDTAPVTAGTQATNEKPAQDPETTESEIITTPSKTESDHADALDEKVRAKNSKNAAVREAISNIFIALMIAILALA